MDKNTSFIRPFKKGLQPMLFIFLVGGLLTGCSSGKWGFPYKAPVQQGNWITAKDVALLEKGMSPEQVKYALGSPTLTDIFHPDRWDYPFYFKPGKGEPVQRNFSVWFVDGKLDHWEGDEAPENQPADFQTQMGAGQSSSEPSGDPVTQPNPNLQDSSFQTTPLE